MTSRETIAIPVRIKEWGKRPATIAFVVLACLVVLGCTAEPEEDWSYAEAYFECFFDAYEVNLGQAQGESAVDDAAWQARKQCHVPPRGAVRSAEAAEKKCNEHGWTSEHCNQEDVKEISLCYSQAESLIMESYSGQADMQPLETGWTAILTQHVCHPDSRLNPELDGSEAG